MSQDKKITDPPRTVKEAIDWLICIGGDEAKKGQPNSNNCKALENAIKALTGSRMTFYSDIQTLIKKLASFLDYKDGTINGGGIIKKNGYTSAYNTNATWPTCGQGGTCSCCTSNGNCTCKSKSPSACDGSCCNTCDIRICAGIFVALVPALETALRELREKCSARENNSKKITDSSLKEHFKALGYQESDLNNSLTGAQVNNKLSGATSSLRGINDSLKRAFESTVGRKDQNGFTATDKSVGPTTTPSTTPKTVREMLLWLMGLPYCEGYKDFVGKLKEKKDVLGSSTSSGRNQDNNPLAKQLSAVIFQLPTVFYSVEGHISYLKEVFEQFKNGGQVKFKYPTTDTDMLNTLSAYVAVCYPILKYLMQRCDKENNNRRRQRRGTGAGTTPTDEKDGAWGYLTVSGLKNDAGQQQQPQAPSNVPKTALRDFLVFMGFNATNNKVTGEELYKNALKECFGQNVKTDDEDEDRGQKGGNSKDQKLPALRKLAKKVLQGLYSSSTGGASGGGSSSSTTTPTTIRQMMLWLIGLPLTTAYKGSSGNSLVGTGSRVLQGINQNDSLKELEQGQSGRRYGSTSITGKHFKQQLKDSIVGMIMLFQRIEGGLGSVLEFLKEGFKDGGGQAFTYESFPAGKTLFTEFNTYVYKVHVQLRFLKVMCKTEKANGGWKDCQYDNTSGSGVGDKITCGCSYMAPCCALPLKHFLTNNGNSGSGSGTNKFKLCQNGDSKKTEHLQMGFKAYVPQSSSGSTSTLTGASITPYLEQLLDDIPTTTQSPSPPTSPKPLSLLTQYCVAIGNMEPQSLGDHFDVFRELANGMWSKIKSGVEGNLQGITTSDNNGQTASGKLQQALKAVMPNAHNESPHPSDLVSLTGCNGGTGNPCSPFIASLSQGLYKYCDPSKLQSPAQKINWLYMKMSGLYGKLTHLHKSMKDNCKCCPEGTEASSSKCNGITQCPNCLPLLYKMGLVFGDPTKLGADKNKCSELMEKMKKVLDATSKLCVVFRSIDDKRFWPYLLFSAMVVQGKNDKLNGDAYIKTYTLTLGGEYQKHLEAKKKELEKTAQEYETERQKNLACCGTEHTYDKPAAGTGTATVVTLTLYFHKDGVTTKFELKAPHHGPDFNPLVRLYPRNLKAIVDWLLRIGQTRLEQGTEKGVEDMITTFWPRIQTHLSDKDQNMFKQLVQGVVKLMGLENKGKKELGEEVEKELEKTKKSIEDKLNGNGDGFSMTFQSILTFKPNKYIDKVIKDFGERVCTVSGKQRSFDCIAKSVSECMNTALGQIKQLANTNKELEKTYGIQVPDVNNDIQEVSELNNISTLQTLCEGFQKFHDAYTTVTKAFKDHLDSAKNGAWSNITMCVEAFQTLGKCVEDIEKLNGMSGAEKMKEASEKLEEISKQLEKVHTKLNEGEQIKTFSEKVDEFITKLDEALKTKGMEALETALAEALNGKSGSNTFSDFLKSYVSELITKMKSNSIGDDKNKECDIHLRVRNDLQQLSECLKVMCEVCSTGMKDFANTLKECVDKGKEHLDEIKKTKGKLEHLNLALERFNKGFKQSELTEFQITITTIHSLLSNKYIYNPPIIVSTFITQDDVNKMTEYLKQLPDLIRDRYVLQKWKDDSAHFCGVQEFKGGIVKQTDTDGIKQELQDMLRDTYHNATDVTIHTFQVRALIYNFCHKEAMEEIGSGVRLLYFVSHYVNKDQETQASSSELKWEKIKGNNELKRVVDDICGNSYLKYFATHLRDSTEY